MTGPPRTKDEGGVGCAIGDYDNDGDLDIFVPNYGHNLLYRNNSNGTFTEVGQALGVGVENHAVGADWGDYDNDGDLDLSVISYDGEPGAQTPLNALFRNDGAAGFVNVLDEGQPAQRRRSRRRSSSTTTTTARIDLSITDGYGPIGRPLRVPQRACRPTRRSAASACSCSTRRATTRASAPKCGCSTRRARSSPRARW